MAQRGHVCKRHGAWYVRFREKIVENGKTRRKERAIWLCSAKDYPKKSEVVPLAVERMARVNRTAKSSDAGVNIVDYFEKVYVPAITGKLADSTVKGYKDSWRCHVKKRIRGRVRDFRTVDGENLMTEIEAANKGENGDLAHGTYRHIKVTLSAMFTFAKRKGVYEGANPMTGVTIPKGRKHGRKRHVYSLQEVEAHLQAFADNPLVQAIIGTGAFAGLRLGEIRGLWVEDDESDVLNIRRSVWRTIVKDTKTEEDEEDPGVVPIIRPLRLLLDRVKPAYGWLFPNTIGGALDLHNLAERVIKPRFQEKGLPWKGWHAYRRGLATNLHAMGVDDKTIQAILRHEDVGTTQRCYIKTPSRIVTDAMAKLEAKIGPRGTFVERMGASAVVS
jgi:integrase